MAKFIQQEMTDLNKTGKRQTYYRMEVKRNIGMLEFIRTMTGPGSAMDKGRVVQVITEMGDRLSSLLAEGYSVTIDGIGTFTAALGVDKWNRGEEMDTVDTRRTARSITVTGVNFKADKQFVKATALKCDLTRGGKRCLHRSPYTKEQRWQMAEDFLSDPQHPLLRLADYVRLTGVSRSMASRELREYLGQPHCQLATIGKGASLVYVKKTGES